MVFQTLHDSYKRNELILIDGGFCRFREKKDGSIVIYEIFSTKKGSGKKIIDSLLGKTDSYIQLKCPIDLPSNGFYKHLNFEHIGTEITPKGNKLNIWRKYVGNNNTPE